MIENLIFCLKPAMWICGMIGRASSAPELCPCRNKITWCPSGMCGTGSGGSSRLDGRIPMGAVSSIADAMRKRVCAVTPRTVTGISYCSKGGDTTLTGRWGVSSSPETAIHPSGWRSAARCATGPRSAHATAKARSSAGASAAATSGKSAWTDEASIAWTVSASLSDCGRIGAC